MKSARCDAAIVQLIVTEYDEHGRPIGERTSQPFKVFRARSLDFWTEADKAVKQAEAAPTPPTPAPPAVRRKR